MKKTFAFFASLLIIAAPATYAAPAKKQPPVVPITAAGLKKAIAARKGKVVLVNFWATWCGPCVEEFPDLVKLQKRYAGKGLSVLFVSADDQKSKVGPFVTKHGLTSPSWIIQGDPFEFIPQFDPKIKGAFGLPRTYLYDRKGKLITVFSQGKSYSEFEKLVKPRL